MDLNGFALNAMSGGIFSCLITQDRDASNRWAKTRLGFHKCLGCWDALLSSRIACEQRSRGLG